MLDDPPVAEPDRVADGENLLRLHGLERPA